MDIDGINDDNDANVCNDHIINNNLSGKQNLTN